MSKHKDLSIEQNYDQKEWDQLVLNFSGRAHYMQSSSWGESKAKNLWPYLRLIASSKQTKIAIQLFTRIVPGLGMLYYAPEVSGIDSKLVPEITKEIKSKYKNGLAFKLELYQDYSKSLIDSFIANGWVVGNSVQPRDTVIVDLNGTEDEVFARMKKRARYETRVAQRNNVKVEKLEVTQERLDKLMSLIDVTAERSGAFFRNRTYANNYQKTFAKYGQGNLYFAWHDKDLLAAAYVINFGKSAWYKDGGSVRLKSNFMAPRLLQWEIMRDLQKTGVVRYDLSGIPATDELETSSMKGLHTFKTGFCEETSKLMPALELPLSMRYKFWPKLERQFLRLYSGLKKDFWS